MPWEFAFFNPIAGNAPQAANVLAEGSGEALSADTLMDSDAFAAFYSRSARPLWAYLARVSADRALADDLMQESFVRFLCATRPEFSPADGELAARRYLFRIATNLLRDHWRRPVSASIEEIPEEFFADADHSAQADSQAVLGPALARMRPRERQILWLAHAEGYSHREIAQITGLASASIRLLLFRARRKIARLLNSQAAPLKHDCRASEQDTEPRSSAAYRSQP
jgi:RNA polymerase sigma-70 factor (ECF subfamily)